MKFSLSSEKVDSLKEYIIGKFSGITDRFLFWKVFGFSNN